MTEPRAEDYSDLARKVEDAEADLLGAAAAREGLLPLIDRVVEAVGVVILNVIVILVILNAGGRYLFSRPLVWTEEIVAALLIWLVMIGAYLAFSRRQTIASGVVLERLPERWQRLVRIVIDAAMAVSFAWIAWVGWQYLGLFGGDRTPYFGFPKGFYLSALPVAAAAMVIASVVAAVETARRRNP